jgi:hypothetical protein
MLPIEAPPPVERVLWESIRKEGTQEYVANVDTHVHLFDVEGCLIPVTVNCEPLENAYVSSPYNGVITYPLEERRHLPSRWQRAGIGLVIRGIAPWLRWGGVQRVAIVNNWMMSTNLYPSIPSDSYDACIEELRSRSIE